MSEIRSEISRDDETLGSTEFMDIVRIGPEESEGIPLITRTSFDDPVSWNNPERTETGERSVGSHGDKIRDNGDLVLMDIRELYELHTDLEMWHDDALRIFQETIVLIFLECSSDDPMISSRIEELDTIEYMRESRYRSIDRNESRKRDDPVRTILVVCDPTSLEDIPVLSHIDHLSLDDTSRAREIRDRIMWMIRFPEMDPCDPIVLTYEISRTCSAYIDEDMHRLVECYFPCLFISHDTISDDEVTRWMIK